MALAGIELAERVAGHPWVIGLVCGEGNAKSVTNWLLLLLLLLPFYSSIFSSSSFSFLIPLVFLLRCPLLLSSFLTGPNEINYGALQDDSSTKNRTEQSTTEERKILQDRTEENRRKQNRTLPDRTTENRTLQDRTEQNKTEKNRTLPDGAGIELAEREMMMMIFNVKCDVRVVSNDFT